MKITVLTENTAFCDTLTPEHGLSLYIEANDKKILFDMGQSDIFFNNAKKLGIDLSFVDIAILSHGHYDHGGGINTFLEINKKAPIYVNENVFGEYFSGTDRYIGLAPEIRQSDRIIMVGDEFEICQGFKLISCNQKERPHPFGAFGLCEKNENGFSDDRFEHEHYLLVNDGEKDVLISGCSHKGILNIAEWFDYDVFVGGMHLNKLDPASDADREELDTICRALLSKKGIYYTGHCTGTNQYEFLRTIMGERIRYISCGCTLDI